MSCNEVPSVQVVHDECAELIEDLCCVGLCTPEVVEQAMCRLTIPAFNSATCPQQVAGWSLVGVLKGQAAGGKFDQEVIAAAMAGVRAAARAAGLDPNLVLSGVLANNTCSTRSARKLTPAGLLEHL